MVQISFSYGFLYTLTFGSKIYLFSHFFQILHLCYLGYFLFPFHSSPWCIYILPSFTSYRILFLWAEYNISLSSLLCLLVNQEMFVLLNQTLNSLCFQPYHIVEPCSDYPTYGFAPVLLLGSDLIPFWSSNHNPLVHTIPWSQFLFTSHH